MAMFVCGTHLDGMVLQGWSAPQQLEAAIMAAAAVAVAAAAAATEPGCTTPCSAPRTRRCCSTTARATAAATAGRKRRGRGSMKWMTGTAWSSGKPTAARQMRRPMPSSGTKSQRQVCQMHALAGRWACHGQGVSLVPQLFVAQERPHCCGRLTVAGVLICHRGAVCGAQRGVAAAAGASDGRHRAVRGVGRGAARALPVHPRLRG